MSELSRITKEQWASFKKSTEVDPNLQTALERSLEVRPALRAAPPAGALASADEDSVSFNFDIKIVSIAGTFWKSGKLEFTASVIGVQVGHTVVDLSAGSVCFNPSVGVEQVKYCFEVRGRCLYTTGYVDGWFHKKQTWEARIVCF